MQDPRPFLKLAGVSIRTNERLVFRNTDWTFTRDQNWALVGANGSGKTLLARAIAGELPVIKGEIRYGFRVPPGGIPEDKIVLVTFEQQRALAGEAPPAARWFSMEQDEALPVEQFLSQDSVEEVNPFEIRTRPPKAALYFERYRKKVVDLLKIEPLMEHSLTSLSTGEMRKILLARALLKRPRLLILDDVFTGLDFRYRIQLRDVLEQLIDQGDTRILLIAPGPAELPHGITHILCVDHCRVTAQGPRRIMMRHPRVQKLFDSGKIRPVRTRSHFLPGHLHSKGKSELVRMEKVSVQYDGNPILSNINWTITRGESWALMGPNGSGKSTLLSLIDGDNPQAYANDIYLFGRRRGSGESVWNLKKRIGWISSELHLHFPEDQTCFETVISGFQDSDSCYRAPSPQQRKIAQNLLAQFGIGQFSRNSFGSISTGIQRMTLLARALVKSPDLLLLDEPCQGLDIAHRTMFLSIIESLLRIADTTIVYVTHVSEEIPKGLRKVLYLKDGRILKIAHFGLIENC